MGSIKDFLSRFKKKVENRSRGALGGFGRTSQDFREELGYQERVTYADLLKLYQRDGLAKYISELFPSAIWTEGIEIRTDGDVEKENDQLYLKFKEINNKVGLISALKHADIQLSISEYSVIFFGFDDNTPPNQPLQIRNGLDIKYIKVFNSAEAKISIRDTDPNSDRYNHPIIYQIRDSQNNNFDIHYSRVLHIIDEGTASITSNPRLLNVYDILNDIKKLVGSSVQSAYYNARGGLWVDIQQEGNIDQSKDVKTLKMIEEFINQQIKALVTQNGKVQVLNFPVLDPSSAFKVLIGELAGSIGIPQRMLLGSEEAKLASVQDGLSLVNNIRKRRSGLCTNNFMKPMINYLIETKVFNEVEYVIEWEDLVVYNDAEKLDNAKKLVDMLSIYLHNTQMESLLSVDALSRIIGIELTNDLFDDKEGDILDLEPDDEEDADKS